MIEKALGVLARGLEEKYGNAVFNIRHEHTDQAGYWFSYELKQDSRRQTWCVRHYEVEG